MDGGHVGISRAQSGIFCAAEAGRPGHRQRHKNTRNTFPTRIYTHKLNSAILGPTGGHRPVRPQGGAARVAPTVGATTSDISRHAASQTRGHARHSTQAKRPGARTAPAHPPTPTHPHPCSAQSSPASRTERLPAARGSARPAAARAQMPLSSPCSRLVNLRAVGLGLRARTFSYSMVYVFSCGAQTGARRQTHDARARAVAWRSARPARCARAAFARARGTRAARARASSRPGVFCCGAQA